MLLYILGLGATNPIPSSAWTGWTSGYTWGTYYGLSFVPFPPLFGHQYSHCWIDFRHIADAYMNEQNITYFENSRRATLAQRLYCIANPLHHSGYGSNVWGLTASDIPSGYSARGAPPAENDDGTIAPTAPGGSVMFAPEVCIPALRYMYDRYRTNLWTGYGYRDAFNVNSNWWGRDTLGLDQGPIVIAIENYRTQRVWSLFMQNPEIRLGLDRAGFMKLGWAVPRVIAAAGTGRDAVGLGRLDRAHVPGRVFAEPRLLVHLIHRAADRGWGPGELDRYRTARHDHCTGGQRSGSTGFFNSASPEAVADVRGAPSGLYRRVRYTRDGCDGPSNSIHCQSGSRKTDFGTLVTL